MTDSELIHTTTTPACPFCHGRDVQELAEDYFNCRTCDTEFDVDEEGS